MFDLIFAFICIVPNIYLFLRVRRHFIKKEYWWHYTVIYLLLVAVYPINSWLIETSAELLYNPISLAARYILPIYMYAVLLVLLFDLFLLLNRFFRFLTVEQLTSDRFRIAGISVLLLVAVGTTLGGIINFNLIRTTEYRVDIARKSATIAHLKIAFVSDFHLKERSDIHFVERFVRKIEEIQPDVLIFGGDLFEGRGEGAKMDQIAGMFRGFHPKYGVFAVLGNHEGYGGYRNSVFFRRAGITLLRDSVATIGNAFNLAGRYDNRYRGRLTTAELLKAKNDSLPVILIDHRPTDIAVNSQSAVDLQFSGHTHNGQLFPFNLITRAIYPLSWGYRQVAGSHFIVSSGIMLWGPPVRTTGKSEIVVVDVDFQ